MTDFQHQLIAHAESAQTHTANTSAYAAPLRESGKQSFLAQQVPTRKTENWKYTSLFGLTSQENAYASSSNKRSAAGLDGIATIPALDAQRLVFINGHYSPELSSNEDIAEVVQFSNANDQQLSLIAENLGTVVKQDEHFFAALNNAQLDNGVLVHIKKNQQLNKAVQITHITTVDEAAFVVPTRILILLDTSSQATVVEHFISTDDVQNSLVNAITEIKIAANAKLNHYRLQLMQEDAVHIGGVHVDLDRDATYESFQISLGSKLTRNDIVVNHNVGGSHCELKGVYLPQNKQVVDFHTNMEHTAAHCTTNEVFRGIMADKSKAIFNGRIHIHPDAQKTLAELSNKNLLLSNEAEINTKPELEIYADDVRCAHGATIAQLDEQARFYLQSRGISAAEADVMLSFGFINELLENLPHDAIRNLIRPILAKRFGRDESLIQHIG